MTTRKAIAAVALKPDGSTESVWCTDSRIGDLDRFFRPIKLPPKTIIIPFPEGVKFMEVPTYEKALKQKIGHLRP